MLICKTPLGRLTRRLRRLARDLGLVETPPRTQRPSPPPPPPKPATTETSVPPAPAKNVVPVPSHLDDARLGPSKTAPLVLWGLVALAADGVEVVSGADIARVVNERLPIKPVAPPNISRALRSKTLVDEPWVTRVESDNPRQPMFALGDGWQEAWQQVFGEAAPELTI